MQNGARAGSRRRDELTESRVRSPVAGAGDVRPGVPESAGRSLTSVTAFPDARILIVDDDLAALVMMKRLLWQIGYTNVLCLGGAAEVLARLATFRPQLIILDVWMPAINGIVLLEQLRRRAGGYPDVPVLVVSGDPDPRTRNQALASGAQEYLLKPLDLPELVERVHELVARQASRARGDRFG